MATQRYSFFRRRADAPAPLVWAVGLVFALIQAAGCSTSGSTSDGSGEGGYGGGGGMSTGGTSGESGHPGTGGASGRGGTGGAGGWAAGAGGSAGAGAGGNSAGGHGGATGTGGAAGRGGTSGTGGAGAGTGGGAGSNGTLCGTSPCSSNQVCVHPSCGGGNLACDRLPDGGQCAAGWTYHALCSLSSGGSGSGCEPPPCTPLPSFCADVPSACGGTPTCTCLPSNICQGHGQCGIISAGGNVMCLSA
jgi:hypothetical protein